MADVREVGLTGLEARHDLERLGDVEMGRVRAVTQRAENQDVDAVENGPRLVGEPAAVGQIRERSETKTQDGPRAVEDRDRLDAHRIDVEARRNCRQADLRNAAALFLRRVKDVGEGAPQIADRALVGVGRDRAAFDRVEPPHFVHAHDVIGVAVREKNRIDPGHAVGQRLHAQIGGGVDQDRRPILNLDIDRRSRAAIARIGRPAHGTGAADHRHTV